MSDAPIRSSSPDDRRATLALTLVADVGEITYHNLVATFGTATRALHAAFEPSVAHDAYARADRAQVVDQRVDTDFGVTVS